MGVTTETDLQIGTTSGRRRLPRLPARLRTSVVLRRLALASVVANTVIVVTGGAVRLTGSGLGCPTWPRCTASSLTPTRETAAHGIIEFANRQLTTVLVIVAIATWLVSLAVRTERRLATFALLGIPAQAVLGGIVVLTDLNPWLVALHFLLSMAMIAITFLLWWRLRDGVPDADTRPRVLTRVVTLAAMATLIIGTIVTGSGPHAGDLRDGKVRRIGLKPSSMSQLHADAVMVLVGLTVGLVVLVYALRASRAVRRGAVTLLVVELAQGVVGYTQYFLALPELLVGIHMLGACLVWLATLQVLLHSEPRAARARSDSRPGLLGSTA